MEYFNKNSFLESLAIYKFFKHGRLPDGKKVRVRRARVLLDLGCGSAVHFPYLSPFFYLVGVDLSEKMIEKALSLGRKSRRTSFVVADFREIRFSRKLDGAYSVFATLAHLVDASDFDMFLENLKRNLRRGAGFVFDLWNALPFMLSPQSSRKFSVKTGSSLIERSVKYKVLPGSLLKVEERIMVKKNSWNLTRDYSYALRFFLRKSVEETLHKHGFEVFSVYSDYDGTPFDDSSQKMVFFTAFRGK